MNAPALECLPLTEAQRTGETVRLALDFGATPAETARMARNCNGPRVSWSLVALVHYLAAHGEAATAARLAECITARRTVQ